MSYCGAVIRQQWTPEELAAYYKDFEAKRPSYVREEHERLGEPFLVTREKDDQFERKFEKGPVKRSLSQQD